MAGGKSPAQHPPIFNDTAESVAADVQALITSRRAFLDGIAAAVTPETATFDNVLGAIALKEGEDSLESGRLILYNKVAGDAKLRAASSAAKKEVTDLYVECLMRDDIFCLVDTLYQKRDTLNLDTESLRLLEERHFDYILNGLGLSDGEKRERLAAVKKRISALSTEFSKSLNEETGAIWLTEEELEGVPDDIVQNLEKGTDGNEGKLRHTFKQPIVLPTLKYAHNADTRKRLFFANENKCNENIAHFKEIIVLRHEMARLLDYEHYSALALVENMAKTTSTVTRFLEDLKTGLTPLARIELTRLKALKAQDLEVRGLPAEDAYYRWDHTYYSRLQREIDYQVDELLVSEYFALKPTVHAMLGIFETVMGFAFQLFEDAQLWHPDVIVYSVWNDEAGGGDFVGYLYMDLHPRPGKYGHACNSNFQASFLRRDGSRHFPSTALICNFSPPTPEKPALLKHRELTTLFHELGHGIHSLAGRTRYREFHGTAVNRDFVEAPSQMLENWCWTPSVLKKLSRHWKTGEAIPDHLVEKLVATEKVNQALSQLVQVHFSMYDAACHTPSSQAEIEALDASKMFNETRDVITLLDGFEDPNATHRSATFGHPVAGYAAMYYGYLYSKVFSVDMFRSVFQKDPMDGAEGRRYRKTVLEKGGSRPVMDSLKEFLGREPSSAAFYQYLGLAK